MGLCSRKLDAANSVFGGPAEVCAMFLALFACLPFRRCIEEDHETCLTASGCVVRVSLWSRDGCVGVDGFIELWAYVFTEWLWMSLWGTAHVYDGSRMTAASHGEFRLKAKRLHNMFRQIVWQSSKQEDFYIRSFGATTNSRAKTNTTSKDKP